MEISNSTVSGIFGAFIGFFASCLFLLPKIHNLEDEIYTRPPVIVVDMEKLALDAVPLGGSEEEINIHFNRVQDTLDAYRNEGFLILTRQGVIHSPEAVSLGVDDLALAVIKDSEGDQDEK